MLYHLFVVKKQNERNVIWWGFYCTKRIDIRVSAILNEININSAGAGTCWRCLFQSLENKFF